MAARMTKNKWTIFLAVMLIIDFVQWVVIEMVLVWFFGVGAIINVILDPIIGVATVGYLQKQGVDILHNPKWLLWLLGTEAMAELSGGFFQVWVGALWFIKKDYEAQQAALGVATEKDAQLQSDVASQRYYAEGVGRVRKEVGADTRTMYSQGIGRPRGRDSK